MADVLNHQEHLMVHCQWLNVSWDIHISMCVNEYGVRILIGSASSFQEYTLQELRTRAQERGSLSLMWKTWTEFQATGFRQAQSKLLWELGSKPKDFYRSKTKFKK